MIQEIVENGIKIYSFPDTEGDEEEAAANKKLRVSVHCVMSVANEWGRVYRIEGNFRGRKLSRKDEHEDFVEKTVVDSYHRQNNMRAHAMFAKKTFTKMPRSTKCTPSKVPSYTHW